MSIFFVCGVVVITTRNEYTMIQVVAQLLFLRCAVHNKPTLCTYTQNHNPHDFADCLTPSPWASAAAIGGMEADFSCHPHPKLPQNRPI
mmetsp:Transcript_18603/g.31087  ORF Transcript_18603/g.31087 Transcript_18603/m.31087 type:complete len:89 (+) Transcript_18603:874-1140(+)